MEMDCPACGSSDNGDEYRGVAMAGGRRFAGGAAAGGQRAVVGKNVRR
jgi:hypothetical protein